MKIKVYNLKAKMSLRMEKKLDFAFGLFCLICQLFLLCAVRQLFHKKTS